MKHLFPAYARHAVVGLGASGLSILRALSFLQIRQVTAMDSRENPPHLAMLRQEMPQLEIQVGGFFAETLQQADYIWISPGISLYEPPWLDLPPEKTEKIGCDIELFLQINQAQHQAPLVAITGTNGKSTVTTLVAKMAAAAGIRVAAAGNLGKSPLDFWREGEQMRTPYDLYVLELSSFQLETIQNLRHHQAAILNIAPDHLDRYGAMPLYIEAKARIYQDAQTCVFNRQDPLTKHLAQTKASGRITSFAADASATDYGMMEHQHRRWLTQNSQPLLACAELQIAGLHNISNALAALALADAANIPQAASLQALREFNGLPHRCRLVRKRNGVRWFNDSKGTNIGATAAAIQGLEKQLILLMGGEGKDQCFNELRSYMAAVDELILFGRDAALIEQALTDTCRIHRVEHMTQAIELADQLAKQGSQVLLSPACASFDQFKSYIERGEIFEREVMQLGAE